MELPVIFLNDTQFVGFQTVPRNRQHAHGFWECCLVTAGSGRFEQEGQSYPLQQGDLFVSDPEKVHEISSLETRDLELFFIAFEIDLSRAAKSSPEHLILRRFLENHHTHRADCEKFQPQFEAIQALRDTSSPSSLPFIRTRLLEILLLQLLRELTPGQLPGQEPYGRGGILESALSAIDAGINAPLEVSDLARHCHLSQRHLRRIFRERLGTTVTAEIRNRKMRHAASLLMTPELSVAEVGYRVGIDDPAHFSRTFKKVYGESPRQFRASGGTPSNRTQNHRRFRTRFYS